MAPSSRRLVEFGFLSAKGKELKKEILRQGGDAGWVKKIKESSDEELEPFADHHRVELTHNQLLNSEYPNPIQSYHLVYESFSRPLEAYYFWAINHLGDLFFGKIDKITDIFAASEQSALFGSSAQRLGLAQDKVVGFLVSIGRLVKDLFAMVRELRIMDERLRYYRGVRDADPKARDVAEIALKSLFVELVEGGAKNVNSVYGLARELQFVTLPDLFFSTHPQKMGEVGPSVDKLDFNLKVKEVLKKKLAQYLIWREETEREHTNRRNHLIKYLRQHYDAIQLYLVWVRPYLKHIRRLGMNEKFLDSADLVAAFEGSVIEIEVLGQQKLRDNPEFVACILLTFVYRTSPTMPFHGQDYKSGPLHMGKVEVRWRSYAWTAGQIEKYKQMRNAEGFELLGSVDHSIKEAMDSLGDALKQYLIEAGERFDDPELKQPKPQLPEVPSMIGAIFDPFISVFRGVSEVFSPLAPKLSFSSLFKTQAEKEFQDELKSKGQYKGAEGLARALCWTHYKNFKNAHGFLTW